MTPVVTPSHTPTHTPTRSPTKAHPQSSPFSLPHLPINLISPTRSPHSTSTGSSSHKRVPSVLISRNLARRVSAVSESLGLAPFLAGNQLSPRSPRDKLSPDTDFNAPLSRTLSPRLRSPRSMQDSERTSSNTFSSIVEEEDDDTDLEVALEQLVNVLADASFQYNKEDFLLDASDLMKSESQTTTSLSSDVSSPRSRSELYSSVAHSHTSSDSLLSMVSSSSSSGVRRGPPASSSFFSSSSDIPSPLSKDSGNKHPSPPSESPTPMMPFSYPAHSPSASGSDIDVPYDTVSLASDQRAEVESGSTKVLSVLLDSDDGNDSLRLESELRKENERRRLLRDKEMLDERKRRQASMELSGLELPQEPLSPHSGPAHSPVQIPTSILGNRPSHRPSSSFGDLSAISAISSPGAGDLSTSPLVVLTRLGNDHEKTDKNCIVTPVDSESSSHSASEAFAVNLVQMTTGSARVETESRIVDEKVAETTDGDEQAVKLGLTKSRHPHVLSLTPALKSHSGNGSTSPSFDSSLQSSGSLSRSHSRSLSDPSSSGESESYHSHVSSDAVSSNVGSVSPVLEFAEPPFAGDHERFDGVQDMPDRGNFSRNPFSSSSSLNRSGRTSIAESRAADNYGRHGPLLRSSSDSHVVSSSGFLKKAVSAPNITHSSTFLFKPSKAKRRNDNIMEVSDVEEAEEEDGDEFVEPVADEKSTPTEGDKHRQLMDRRDSMKGSRHNLSKTREHSVSKDANGSTTPGTRGSRRKLDGIPKLDLSVTHKRSSLMSITQLASPKARELVKHRATTRVRKLRKGGRDRRRSFQFSGEKADFRMEKYTMKFLDGDLEAQYQKVYLKQTKTYMRKLWSWLCVIFLSIAVFYSFATPSLQGVDEGVTSTSGSPTIHERDMPHIPSFDPDSASARADEHIRQHAQHAQQFSSISLLLASSFSSNSSGDSAGTVLLFSWAVSLLTSLAMVLLSSPALPVPLSISSSRQNSASNNSDISKKKLSNEPVSSPVRQEVSLTSSSSPLHILRVEVGRALAALLVILALTLPVCWSGDIENYLHATSALSFAVLLCFRFRFLSNVAFAVIVLSLHSILLLAVLNNVALNLAILYLCLMTVGFLLAIYQSHEDENKSRYEFLLKVLVKHERDKCRHALIQIFPHPTLADRLLSGEQVVDSFQDVSFMNSDIMGFTKLCTGMLFWCCFLIDQHVFYFLIDIIGLSTFYLLFCLCV